MRVLMSTLGSRGDVQPMLALADGLRAQGHAVTFCGPTDARSMVEAAGITFVDLGVDARQFLDEHPEVVRNSPRSLFTTKRLVRELMDRQFSTLEPLAADADLLVGAGLVSAPSSIAASRQLPYRFVAFGAMAIPSRVHAPYLFPVAGLPGSVNSALWWLTDVAVRMFVGDALDAHRRRLGLTAARRLSRVLTPPGSLILAADPELSPPPFDYDPSIAVTGALKRPIAGAAPLPASIESFLAAGPQPIYIGFGSMTDPKAADSTRVIVEAIQRAGVRALISSGWAGLGASLPEHCLVVGEVSHDALFPRLAGVVHHGGAGTTATAARAGVPQLIVPHLLDQFYWAHRVAVLGIGPKAVPKKSLTAARLSPQLGILASDRAMRAAAQMLGHRLRSRDGVAAAVTALEAAVR